MSEEVKIERKKRSLSLIQPTSIPTLGNYLGAMRGWTAFQEDFDTIFGIADLHSITVRQEPAKLRQQTVQLYAMLMAVGLDPKKSILFIQSHVPQHSQLGWLLNCYTQFGELNRMTQFKDKSAQHSDNVDMLDYCKRLVENKVAVVPGTAFMIDDEAPCHYIRMNFSTPSDENIVKGIEIMAQVLKEY